MLKEGSTPLTAYMAGTEAVLLRIEMGGNEGKDIQRYAVDGDEGVPPLADSCQRGRSIPVELGNDIGGEAVEEIRVSFPETSRAGPQRTMENTPRVSAPRSERRQAGKAIGPFQGKCVHPSRGRESGWPKKRLSLVMVTVDPGPPGSVPTNKPARGNARDHAHDHIHRTTEYTADGELCRTLRMDNSNDSKPIGLV